MTTMESTWSRDSRHLMKRASKKLRSLLGSEDMMKLKISTELLIEKI